MLDRLTQYATKEEWLAARAEGHSIGGSDVGPILGAPGFQTEWDVWRTKMGHPRREPDAGTLKAFALGHVYEKAILAHYGVETGQEVQAFDNAIVTHADHPWAKASLDGAVLASGGLVEAKRAAYSGHQWSATKWPLSYECQCRYYLAVTGAPWIDLVGLVGSRLIIHRFEPQWVDDAMMSQVAAWRECHLIGGHPPQSKDVSAACRAHVGELEFSEESEVATDLQERLVDSWREHKAEGRVREIISKGLELDLMESMGCRRLLVPGGRVQRMDVNGSWYLKFYPARQR